MPNSLITRKGQLTIPKAVRDVVRWKVGDRVSFFVRDKEVVLKRCKGTILDLKGSVKPRRKPEDFEELRRAMKDARTERLVK